jgi:hypothetical protein
MVRGTFAWGVLDEKRTHPNTNFEWSKWDFGPISVIPCHNSVGAMAYVETKCVLKSKAAESTKKDPCKIRTKFLSSRRFIPECFGALTNRPSVCHIDPGGRLAADGNFYRFSWR